MQLSFSIDVILGTAGSKTDKQDASKSEITSTPPKAERHGKFTCSTPTKEDPKSPRSFTIEWKPTSCKKSPDSRKSELRERVGQEKRNLYERTGNILQSPPNARVVPFQDEKRRIHENSEDAAKQCKEDFLTKMHNLKALQKRLFTSRYLPYPSETLKNHRVQHHPHHYPFQLPYTQHGHCMQPTITPGLFSPHYSYLPKATNNFNTVPSEVQKPSMQEAIHSPPLSVKKQCASSESENDNRVCSPASDSNSVYGSDHTISPCRLSNDGDADSEGAVSNTDTKTNENTPEITKGQTKSKRVGRRLFTGFQILELEKTFALKPYLNRMERAYISQKVNLTECQIKTWFQNRRTKEKRRGNGSEEEESMSRNVTGYSISRYSNKPMRIPGYGIQLAPTYGPPDQHLQAAIVDYLRRRTSGDMLAV